MLGTLAAITSLMASVIIFETKINGHPLARSFADALCLFRNGVDAVVGRRSTHHHNRIRCVCVCRKMTAHSVRRYVVDVSECVRTHRIVFSRTRTTVVFRTHPNDVSPSITACAYKVQTPNIELTAFVACVRIRVPRKLTSLVRAHNSESATLRRQFPSVTWHICANKRSGTRANGLNMKLKL